MPELDEVIEARRCRRDAIQCFGVLLTLTALVSGYVSGRQHLRKYETPAKAEASAWQELNHTATEKTVFYVTWPGRHVAYLLNP